MLKSAYRNGIKAAYTRFKIAIPLSGACQGADYGVAPSGPEVSHGTDRRSYAPGRSQHLPQDPFNADWLWHNQRLDRMAPGNVSGFGQEVIG